MENELKIRDYPYLGWLTGLAALGYGAYRLVFNFSSPYWYGAVAALVAGALLLTLNYALTITADKSARLLTLDYRSLLFHSTKEIRFDEIQTIRVESHISRDTDSGSTSATYRVVADLKDGGQVPFRSFYSSGSFRKQKIAGELRAFIGLPEAFDATPQGVFRAAPKIGAMAAQAQLEQMGAAEPRETDGVRWELQPIGIGTSPATRWFSPNFKTQGGFLYLAQKAEGQSTGGFLAPLSNMLFRQSLSLYGFSEEDTPGRDKAQGYEALSPALAKHFMAFTNDPAEARRILNPWTQNPLANWGERHPLKQFQSGTGFSQLVVLFSPRGVYLAAPAMLNPDEAEELAALGVELVKSQGM
ncbi:MAG: hypothetical protein LDL50_03115 [Chloroflexi bacterium]|nr:hypothetical protein [Chloroflexota bacterium]MCA2002417.1 hypothetical protein [Chloroflexota bacterium]